MAHLTGGSCPGGCGAPGSTCNHSPLLQNFAAKESYTIDQLVNKLCQTDLKVWKWSTTAPKYASLPYMGFDRDDYTNAAGGIGKVLTFKNIPQYHTLSEDGKAVKWGEMVEAFPEAFVAEDATNENEITVKSLESLRRFYVGDHVLLFTSEDGVNANECCQQEISLNITDIDIVNLTITFDQNVTVKEGDRILRQYHLVQTCGEFANGAALEPTHYFESYYQYFGHKLCFSADELNKCYATAGQVQAVVDAKFAAVYQDLFLQIGNARWRGLNVPEISGVQASQTMGIIPMIYRYHAEGMDIIHNLAGLTVDQAKVRALLEIFEQAQSAQIEGIDNTLMVACTQKFWSALTKLNPAWNAFAGCMPICDNSKEVSFEVKVINTIYGRVEFFLDFFLELYYKGRSFAVVLPKSMSAVYMPMNKQITVSNGNVAIEKVVPGFVTESEEVKNVGKVNCGNCISFWTQLAFIHAGGSSGAYRIIEGLY